MEEYNKETEVETEEKNEEVVEQKEDVITPILETPIKKKRTNWWKIVAIIFIILFALAWWSNGFTKFSITGMAIAPLAEKAKVDFYVMSQCPYGTQVEDAIKPVLDEMKDAFNFNLNFIASDQGDGTFRSLHGEAEVKGDIAQLCAAKYNPDKYMEMVVCMNKNAQAIPANWESCASGLEIEKIKACFEGDEGKQLMKESITKASTVGASGSPTIFINNEPYAGGRTTADFKRAICQAISSKHKACENIPAPVAVDMYVITDKRCKDCNPNQIITASKQLFPGVKITSLDYTDKKSKEMMDKVGLKLLPAYIYGKTLKDTERYIGDERLKTVFLESGEYFFVPSNIAEATFDPNAEICDNKIDDDKNSKIDCDDDYCKQKTECREEKKGNLQVFIMSDCPYGRKAVEALKEIADNLKDISYEVHYIAEETAAGFQSLHGQYEVDEDITQLCMKKYSPEKWLNYIYCRSTKGIKGIDWKTCAAEVDTVKVSACISGGEGKSLLREDIKTAASLGIGASPTWLANNRYQFGGISAESVKQEFCKYNVGLEGCTKTLSQGAAASGTC